MGGIPPSTTGTSPARPTSVRWRIVALLMATAAMCHFNRISITVAGAERIIPEYHIHPVTMGIVYSAYLLVYTLCMTPGGWLIDHRGPRKALMLVGFGSGLFVVLIGLAGFAFPSPFPARSLQALGWLGSPGGNGPWLAATALLAGQVLAASWPLVIVLVCLRGLMGAVNAPIHPGAARVISFWIPAPARSWANGLVVGAALLGIASTYYLFGFLMDWLGWPRAFILAGLATALLAAVWMVYATDRPAQHAGVNAQERGLIEGGGLPTTDGNASQPSHRLGAGGTWLLLRNRSLMLLTLSYAAVGYVQYLFFYWAEYYFDQVLELGKERGRLFATIPNLAMAVGMVAGGWLADRCHQYYGPRWGRMLVPVGGMLGTALFLSLGPTMPRTDGIVICFSAAMACIGATEAPFWVAAVELGGECGGTGAALLNTGGNVGGFLAPWVTPLLSQYIGWQKSILVAGLFCVIGAGLWAGVNPSADSKRH
jgi:sugar phosphate permease